MEPPLVRLARSQRTAWSRERLTSIPGRMASNTATNLNYACQILGLAGSFFKAAAGWTGFINPAVGPVGPPGAPTMSALARGYAVVSTDGGHQEKTLVTDLLAPIPKLVPITSIARPIWWLASQKRLSPNTTARLRSTPIWSDVRMGAVKP